MKHTQLATEICKYIEGENFGLTRIQINPQTSLLESGIIDSLSLQQLIVYLESNYSVEIPENWIIPDRFSCVESIANMIRELSS